MDGKCGACQVASEQSRGLVGDLSGVGNDGWGLEWTDKGIKLLFVTSEMKMFTLQTSDNILQILDIKGYFISLI